MQDSGRAKESSLRTTSLPLGIRSTSSKQRKPMNRLGCSAIGLRLSLIDRDTDTSRISYVQS